MGAAVYAQRAAIGRRGAAVIIVVALVLGFAAALAAQTYVSGEAARVAAPIRGAWVAARDIAAGTLLTKDDLTIAQFPITGEMAPHYALAEAGGAPPAGLTVHALKKGQPVLVGTLLPPEAADTISPLVPLIVTIDGSQQRVLGALNIPLDRLIAAPPPMREGDRFDLWALVEQPTSPGAVARQELRAVLSNIEILSFAGEQAADGIIVAVTQEQLERFFTLTSSGAPMLLTVRSSRRD